jgi:hypothetical protein
LLAYIAISLKVVPLQIIHFHKLKQHDVSILLPFFTTHRRYRVKTMLHCLRQCSVFVREDLGEWGIPRTTDVSGAVFSSMFYIHRFHDIHRSMRSVFYLHMTTRRHNDATRRQ